LQKKELIMRNLFETVVDVGSGLILSTLIQLFIFPFFDLHPTVLESFHIAEELYLQEKKC
jgi:hypothetical protein